MKEGARAREYELALSWLYDCGLIHQVFCVKAPKYPLKAYQEYTAFKLFTVDVGLLSAMNGIDAETLLHGNAIFTEFKGALTEQYVLQQLVQHEPYYWAKSNSQSEIDFLLQYQGSVVPIEVKAEENLQAVVGCPHFYVRLSGGGMDGERASLCGGKLLSLGRFRY